MLSKPSLFGESSPWEGMDFQSSKGIMRNMASDLLMAASQVLPAGCSSSCIARGRAFQANKVQGWDPGPFLFCQTMVDWDEVQEKGMQRLEEKLMSLASAHEAWK
eukprot:symbB.v1.2.033480.t1/scaffold4160.1/size43739/3